MFCDDVLERRNSFLSNECFATNRAVRAFCLTVCSTSSFNCLVNYNCMTLRC